MFFDWWYRCFLKFEISDSKLAIPVLRFRNLKGRKPDPQGGSGISSFRNPDLFISFAAIRLELR